MKSVYYYLSVLIIFLSACHTNKSELETIKVAQFGDVFIYIPLYLANTKGFFKEEGLKVDLINTGGDDKTYAAVIGGSALFGIADPTFVAIAKEQGIRNLRNIGIFCQSPKGNTVDNTSYHTSIYSLFLSNSNKSRICNTK